MPRLAALRVLHPVDVALFRGEQEGVGRFSGLRPYPSPHATHLLALLGGKSTLIACDGY